MILSYKDCTVKRGTKMETSPGELFIVLDDSVSFMNATYDIRPTAVTANIDNEKLEESSYC